MPDAFRERMRERMAQAQKREPSNVFEAGFNLHYVKQHQPREPK